MKKFNHFLVFILVAGMTLYSCDGQIDSLTSERLDDNPAPTAPPTATGTQGNADFTKFVTIGNSLTAGFMDAALYNQGQQNSLGALMAAQLQIAVESDGGTFDSFDQPDINSVDGFNTSIQSPEGTPILGRIQLDLAAGVPSPVVTGDAIGSFEGDKSALNNFGVPGIQVGQLLTPGTGTPGDPAFNGFYARMASSPGTSTILGDVAAAQPTFFTLWIGNNDVLGYAVSGGSAESIFTSQADFDVRFNGAVNTLLATTTAKGVVATIPPVLTIPYFRAVPFNALPLDAASADQLNAAYAAYNGGLQLAVQGMLITEEEATRRTISFSAGQNAFVMEDENLTDLSALTLPNYRQTEATDLIPLATSTALATGVGTQTAAADQYVLTPEEQGVILQRTLEFNTIIATAVLTENATAVANSVPARLALFDVNSGLPGNPNTTIGAFADLLGLDGELGIRAEGQLLDPDFLPNGIYSADGVHPNIRGNAILANEFIKVTEAAFGATIPKISILPLPGVTGCSGTCVSEQ